MLHDDDAIAQRHRLGLVVGDVDRGDAERAQQRVDLQAQRVAQLGIQRRQRLVEQQRARPDGDGAGQCHALPLTARELVDAAIGESRDLHHRQHLRDARLDLGVGHLPDLQAVADVPGHRHVGKQRIGLEHHADIALLDRQVRDVDPVEQHLAAGVGFFEAGDDAQRRGLAAARGAEEHDGLTGMDGEVERLQRAGAVGEGLRAVGQGNGDGFVVGIVHSASSATNFAGRGLAKACSASKSGMIIRKNTSV